MPKIRLVKDVPVHREHGLFAGEIFEITRSPTTKKRHSPCWFIQSKIDKEVGIMYYEAEVVEEEED